MAMAAGYTAKSIDQIRREHDKISRAFADLRSQGYFRQKQLVAPIPAINKFLTQVGNTLGYKMEAPVDKSE